MALAVLRGLEDTIMAGTRAPLIATTTPSVALYILNNKRPFINDMEARLGLQIMVTGSDKLAGANFTIEKGAAPAQPQRRIERNVVNMESGFEGEDENGDFEAREQSAAEPREASACPERPERGERSESSEEGARRRRRRRRGGRGREREEGNGRYADDTRSGNVEDVGGEDEAPEAYEQGGVEDAEGHHEHRPEAGEARGEEGEGGERTRERGGRSRRRGRRGGRRGRERNGERGGEARAQNGASEQSPLGDDQPAFYSEGERRGGESTSGHPEAIADFPNLPADGNQELPAREVYRAQEVAKPRKDVPAAAAHEAEPAAPTRRRTGSSEPRLERIVVGQQLEVSAEDASASNAPARKGWWQRKLGGE